MTQKLDRPIVVTGPPRSGTSVLAGLINWHSAVGPKNELMRDSENATAFLEAIQTGRSGYTKFVERNPLWFDAYRGFGVFKQLGAPMWNASQLPDNPEGFLSKLTEKLDQPRLITKSPSHVFKLPAIRTLFPDCRIVTILRSGEQVAASMLLHKSAGFSARHKDVELESPEGWGLLAERWNQVVERFAEAMAPDMLCVTFDGLVKDAPTRLAQVAQHCELVEEPYFASVQLMDRTQIWRERIAPEHHDLVLELFAPGNRVIKELVS